MIAVVAASTSLWWGSFIIDLGDSISRFVAVSLGITWGDVLRAPLQVFLTAIAVGSTGIAAVLALLYLVYGLFVLYLIVQFIIRLALIDLLLVLAPAALGLWILPGTSGWSRYWLRMFLMTVMQQALQLIALSMAFAFLNEFATIGPGNIPKDFLWQLLISIAFLYLTTRVPSLLGSTGTFDSWFRTITYGVFLASRVAAVATGVGAPAAAAASAGGAAAGAAASGAGSSMAAWTSPVAGVVVDRASSAGSQAAGALGGGQLALPAGNSSHALPPRSMDE